MESALLQGLSSVTNVDDDLIEFLRDAYGDEVNTDFFLVEFLVLSEMLSGESVSCFKDIYKGIKKYTKAEWELIPNIIHVVKLLLINPTSCTPERSFSTARSLKTWLRSTIKNLCFNSLALLNIHKDLTDDLAEIGNDFVALQMDRYKRFGRFVKADF